MDSVHRRNFLKGSLATAAAAAGVSSGLSAGETAPEYQPGAVFHPGEIIDTNVYLFRWAFSHSLYDNTEALVKKLRSHGVIQAWAGSYEGVFHKDITGVNERLVKECRTRGDGFLTPFGTVNPKLPGWKEDLRRCAEDYQMPGIRVHPSYHNYTLEDPVFLELLRLAAEHRLIVQLVCWMEDERHHNPRMIVPTVDPSPLPELAGRVPVLQVVVLNLLRVPGAAVVNKLAETAGISMDMAMLETIEGLGACLKRTPLDRIVFGSYMPYFYIEANLLKFQESEVSKEQATAIRVDNARRILNRARTG